MDVAAQIDKLEQKAAALKNQVSLATLENRLESTEKSATKYSNQFTLSPLIEKIS